MPNGIPHCYELDESISNFRVVGGIFLFFIQTKRNFCKQTVENLIRRHIPASDLGLHFLPMSHKKDARIIWVNIISEKDQEPKLQCLLKVKEN